MLKKRDKKFQEEKKTIRSFSVEFKKSKVKDIVEKRITVRELSQLYKVSRTAVYKWLYLYSNKNKTTRIVVQMESEQEITKYWQTKCAELERLYGQKQLEVEYLNKGYEVISEELGFDVKKKYVQPLLNGFDVIEKNTQKKTATR